MDENSIQAQNLSCQIRLTFSCNWIFVVRREAVGLVWISWMIQYQLGGILNKGSTFCLYHFICLPLLFTLERSTHSGIWEACMYHVLPTSHIFLTSLIAETLGEPTFKPIKLKLIFLPVGSWVEERKEASLHLVLVLIQVPSLWSAPRFGNRGKTGGIFRSKQFCCEVPTLRCKWKTWSPDQTGWKDLKSGTVLLPHWLQELVAVVSKQSSHVCLCSIQFLGAKNSPSSGAAGTMAFKVGFSPGAAEDGSSFPGCKQRRGEKLKLLQ